jgi:hypothetical protein
MVVKQVSLYVIICLHMELLWDADCFNGVGRVIGLEQREQGAVAINEMNEKASIHPGRMDASSTHTNVGEHLPLTRSAGRATRSELTCPGQTAPR